MIHYSPDSVVPWHTPSSLTVDRSTFINDFGSKAIGIYNINGPGVSNGGPVAITAQVTNSTVYNLDASHFIQGPANETGTTPVTTRPSLTRRIHGRLHHQGARPQLRLGGSPTTDDALVLNISADMWQGASQFITKVDGIQEGGVNTVTASHSAGESEPFIFTGNFGPGMHDIAISFLDDLYGGAVGGHNLCVNSIDYDGTHSPSASAVLFVLFQPDGRFHGGFANRGPVDPPSLSGNRRR